MTKYVRKILMLSLTAITFSCQDVIDLDIPNGDPSIVISGRVTNNHSVEVILSSTTPYFDEKQPPRITGAVVILFEDGVAVSTLDEDTVSGRYFSTYQGMVGRSYELEVFIPEGSSYFPGTTWHTRTEVMPRLTAADSLRVMYLTRNTTPAVFEEGYYAMAYLQEPKGAGDRYRLRRWLNDSIFTRDVFILTDENVDGFYFGNGILPPLTVYGPLEEAKNDTLAVEISSITNEYYEFLALLAEQTQNVGSTFDPPPSPIVGNVYRAGDESDYAFGYFAASAIARDTVIFKP